MAVMVVHAVEERGHQRFLAYLKDDGKATRPPSRLRRYGEAGSGLRAFGATARPSLRAARYGGQAGDCRPPVAVCCGPSTQSVRHVIVLSTPHGRELWRHSRAPLCLMPEPWPSLDPWALIPGP